MKGVPLTAEAPLPWGWPRTVPSISCSIRIRTEICLLTSSVARRKEMFQPWSFMKDPGYSACDGRFFLLFSTSKIGRPCRRVFQTIRRISHHSKMSFKTWAAPQILHGSAPVEWRFASLNGGKFSRSSALWAMMSLGFIKQAHQGAGGPYP